MKSRTLLTPTGGALIAICFFLPWIKISCMGTSSYSGLKFGGVYWAVFAAGVIFVLAYFALRRLNRILLLRQVVWAMTVVSLGVIAYGCLMIAGGKRFLLIHIGPDDVKMRLQIGAYGTILGYILAWLGCRRSRSKPSEPTPSEQIESAVEAESVTECDAQHTSA